MNRKNLSFGILLLLIFLVFSSCRLGEILSEADPETEAEIEKNDAIPPPEDDLKE